MSPKRNSKVNVDARARALHGTRNALTWLGGAWLVLSAALACDGSVSGVAVPEIEDAQMTHNALEGGAASTPTPTPTHNIPTADAGGSAPNDTDASVGEPSATAAEGSASATGSAGSAPSSSVVPPMPGVCRPVLSHHDLPQRAVVSDHALQPQQQIILTEDLYRKFYAQCGACHVDQAQGEWRVTRETFGATYTQKAIDRITTDDLTLVMPPGAGAYSAQPAGSPVRDLVANTQAWLANGSPNKFTLTPTPLPNEVDTASPYVLAAEVAAGATDLGTCLPAAEDIGTEVERSTELDTMFAAATSFRSLPKVLSQTDLVTLDSALLARYGVVSYAPTYALFSDSAGKMRYVRVPRGTSVKFDAARQEFDVPANTRLYKTFLKPVTDVTGQQTWRKIETRLIVSRPDIDLGNGKFESQALFASYAWNEAETEAYLVTDPRRDSQPFADRIVTYFQDEPQATDFFTNPDLVSSPTALDTLQKREILRHWGIPSSDRCIDCHRGSPNHSFLLGFSPIQLRRVARGESGEYNTPEGEEVEADELSQLQRLIDFGVVTGMQSEQEVERLENTQSAPPRNDHELKAQAYMVGNCGFCHNPSGLPSVQNPELTELLNFWPNRHLWPEHEGKVDKDGNPVKVGVFQFPLSRKSPRIKRGPNQDISIPYITPSLRDYPIPFSDLGVDDPNATEKAQQRDSYYKSSFPKMQLNQSTGGFEALPGPWRSLIYRNVDAPYTYADHFAVYPHMPMNVGGYDCQARSILANWMISIPAARVEPDKNEDRVFYCDPPCESEKDPSMFVTGGYFGESSPHATPADLDMNEQPYVEIAPGSDGYADAISAAEARLQEYQASARAQCEPFADILDPTVLDLTGAVREQTGRSFESPPSFYEEFTIPPPGVSPVASAPPAGSSSAVASASASATPSGTVYVTVDGIPDHPHWVNTDLSEPNVSQWEPKNLSWDTIFADPSTVTNPVVRRTVETLKTLHVSQQLREYALSDRPLGFWEEKESCDLTGQPTAASLQSDNIPLPMWLSGPDAVDNLDRPIYVQAPGETVFTMICSNCHGPEGDSKGRQAGLVSTLTGGNTRVANFQDGLFGPVDQPGGHISSVFAPQAGPGDTTDDVVGRYMAFMALGGTQRTIPRAVLSIVRNTSVMGTFRTNSPSVASANMLETAVGLCRAVLGGNALNGVSGSTFDLQTQTVKHDGSDGLITSNGDFELWQTLCTLDNPLPLVAVRYRPASNKGTIVLSGVYSYKDSHGNVLYPADAPAIDHNGQVVMGVDSANLAPKCWLAFDDDTGERAPEDESTPCPDELVGADGKLTLYKWDDADIREWATRGAANAGFAVYTYLDALFRRGYQRKPAYNHCEQLAP